MIQNHARGFTSETLFTPHNNPRRQRSEEEIIIHIRHYFVIYIWGHLKTVKTLTLKSQMP